MGIDLLQILGGDWRFFWPENVKSFAQIPYVWDSLLNTGLGMPTSGTLWLISYLQFTSLFSLLGLPWLIITLLFWVLPPVILSFIGAMLCAVKLLHLPKKISLLAGFIYVANTYFLLVLSGGQLGIALAYSLIPFVVYRFIINHKNISIYNSLILGLVLSMQLLFDPRFVYLSVIITSLYWLLHFKIKNILKQFVYLYIIPFALMGLIHSFWILPLLFSKASPIPHNYDSLQQFAFFSFADFSHTISLLHPNWPENIFGKVDFLKQEFLIVTLLSFCSLLFVSIKNKKASEIELTKFIGFLVVIALLGAFLAKGVNDPFPDINSFLFTHVPGMQMYRDPTKFYSLIAFAYSLLIPFSIYKIAEYAHKKTSIKLLRRHIHILFMSLFIVIWSIILSLHGGYKIFEKFVPQSVPQEYIALKNYLLNDNNFSRTLWIPQWQRFGFFSYTHPAVGRDELISVFTRKERLTSLQDPHTQTLLQQASIKYVIIPEDTSAELYVDDHKYSEKIYQQTLHDISSVSWLKPVKTFGKIHVFEILGVKDHFWSPNNINITYQFINPTKYLVHVTNAQKNSLLVFAEGYASQWTANVNGQKITSKIYNNKFNSFVLPQTGEYDITIEYTPQSWVSIGAVVGLITLIFTCSVLIVIKRRKK